ncbi:MAG: rRNA maturation RNase YbeY [Gemmatimonadota bacterium]
MTALRVAPARVTLRIHLNRLEEWPEAAGLDARLRRAVEEAVATAGARVSGEVSVTLLPDEEMRSVNRRFTGQDRATDVLAFDLGRGDRLLGDIYVAPGVARRSAVELELSAEEELLRLVIHGALHLLGHDHPAGQERYASPMFDLQEAVLRRVRAPGDGPPGD